MANEKPRCEKEGKTRMIAPKGALKTLDAYALNVAMKRRKRKRPPKKKTLELFLAILQIVLTVLEILKAILS